MVFNIFSIKPKNTVHSDSASSSNASSTSSNEGLPKALSKFLADPMRTANHPDVVGRYVDPMGGAISAFPDQH
ncbi:hypothetical protein BGW37DRAFT_522749 [Umbelopsis sp. PMI_123]|nr:hypothetical protein BGW37DRAFT_522749 [Umbelopsis sp. PMI_123]